MDAIFLSSVVPKTLTTLFRPLGVYQLAWYIRKHGYDAQVLEFMFKLSEDDIIKHLSKFITPKTQLLGLGLMTNLTGFVVQKFENVLFRVRKTWPHVKIVVGGPGAPFWSRLHRNRTLFDYVVTGHGEDIVLALCNHYCRGEPHPQFEMIDGNRFIKENFSMPHGYTFNIAEGDHLWHKNDCIQRGESLPLELGRGCIFKCKFCRYPYIGKGKNDFTRNMECVKNELIDNYEKWGVTNYYMLDDTFNADQERMKAFADMVRTLPFKINYATYLRADLLHAHPETQELLLESGLKGCYLGIETFNKEAAALIGKPWSASKAKDFVPKLHHDIWKGQVNMQLGYICGIPPETWDDYVATNQWNVDNGITNWVWHALSINRDAHDQFKSDFDINAEQYGFEWVLDDGKPMWKTNYCDRKTAVEWEIQLKEMVKDHQKLGCWYLIELGNYGYDLEVMRHIKQVDMPWKEINVRRKAFLDSYIKDLSMLV